MLDVLAEHDHRETGVGWRGWTAARRPSSVKVGGHADVGDYQVGMVLGDGGVEPFGVPGDGGDAEAESFEQAGESFAEQDRVFGQDHPYRVRL